MKRRAFITLLGGVATRGQGAARRADAAHRRSHDAASATCSSHSCRESQAIVAPAHLEQSEARDLGS
jgi:hypothetical protein